MQVYFSDPAEDCIELVSNLKLFPDNDEALATSQCWADLIAVVSTVVDEETNNE